MAFFVPSVPAAPAGNSLQTLRFHLMHAFPSTPSGSGIRTRPVFILVATVVLALVSIVGAVVPVIPGLPQPTSPSVAAPGTGNLAEVTATANFEQVQPGQQVVVAVVLDVEEGYHAQSHRPLQDFLIPYELKDISLEGGSAEQPLYPQGHIENYPAIAVDGDGDLSVYTDRAVTFLPVTVASDVKPGSVLQVSGTAQYQICDDQNCFPPKNVPWSVEVPIASEAVLASGESASLFDDFEERQAVAESTDAEPDDAAEAALADIVGEDAKTWSAGWAFLMAICAGLIFNIMPCVLPVLPMKAWGFYEVANHNRGKSFALGLVFAAGLISVFIALAILILPLKLISWGSQFSNPWFIWPLVALLVVLGFGLFGAFTTSLPESVYRFTPRHDTYSGNFAFGALTAILATPCTAPLLPPVLLWAAAQPTTVGVMSVAAVGVGMALPYLILSLFPQLARNFPRSGPWPELFKQMLGFLMLAAAAYFAGGRLLAAPTFWWLPIAVIATASLYLIVRTAQLSNNALPVGIACAIAVVALFGGIAITPLAGTFSTQAGGAGSGDGAAAPAGGFAHFEDEAFEAARASGRPVLVKFTANWCITCQAIERTVYSQPDVWNALADKDVAVFKVDLTNSGVPGEDLLYELNESGGIPLTAIWIPGRREPVVISSLYTADQLQRVLAVLPSTDEQPTDPVARR